MAHPASWFAAEEHRAFSYGEGAGETGALLVHGFMGSPMEMRPLAQALAEAGIAARGPLLPGFGSGFGELDRTRAADWLRAGHAAWDEVADRFPRAVLVGFSMGGALALHLAARRPPTRLVLLAPLSRLADWRAPALPVIRRVVKDIRPYAKADFADPRVRHYFGAMDPTLDLDDPAVRARLRREMRISTAVLDELRRVSTRAAGLAPRVTAPTLVLQGMDDRKVLPPDTRRLVARLGGPVAYHEVPADHRVVAPDRPCWPRVRELVVDFATGAEAGTTAPEAERR